MIARFLNWHELERSGVQKSRCKTDTKACSLHANSSELLGSFSKTILLELTCDICTAPRDPRPFLRSNLFMSRTKGISFLEEIYGIFESVNSAPPKRSYMLWRTFASTSLWISSCSKSKHRRAVQWTRVLLGTLRCNWCFDILLSNNEAKHSVFICSIRVVNHDRIHLRKGEAKKQRKLDLCLMWQW